MGLGGPAGLRYASQAGPVAQLDRALPSEGKGRTFESSRVRQFFQSVSWCGLIARKGLGST